MSKASRQAKIRKAIEYIGRKPSTFGLKFEPHEHLEEGITFKIKGSRDRARCICGWMDPWTRTYPDGHRLGPAYTPRTRPERAKPTPKHPAKRAARQKLRQRAIEYRQKYFDLGLGNIGSIRQWVKFFDQEERRAKEAFAILRDKLNRQLGSVVKLPDGEVIRSSDYVAEYETAMTEDLNAMVQHESETNQEFRESIEQIKTDFAIEAAKATFAEESEELVTEEDDVNWEEELRKAIESTEPSNHHHAITVLLGVYRRRPEHRERLKLALLSRGFSRDNLVSYVAERYPDHKVTTKTTKTALFEILHNEVTKDGS